MSTDNFYKNLQELKNFQDISKNSSFKDIPKDWYIIASDVKNSTQAIKDGKYKEVNILGALTIIAILNLKKEIELPFIFGGDGATIMIPPSLLDDAKQSLLAVQKIAQISYNLELRIGIIPVDEIYKHKKEICVSKFKISHNYSQAMIRGGGRELCDELLKDSDSYHIKDSIQDDFEVNIEGLECRWENILSPKDETISILIRAKEESYYEDILKNLETILGTKQHRNPVNQKNTILSFDSNILDKEISIYTQNKVMKFLLTLKLKFINFIGNVLMNFKIGDWATYKKRVVSATDTEKFDDMLRMVISSSFEQTKKLENYLEKEYQAKNLTYGLHKSDSSLITCLIFERHGKHIHFVDSSNGGYAMAASNLKEKSLL